MGSFKQLALRALTGRGFTPLYRIVLPMLVVMLKDAGPLPRCGNWWRKLATFN